MLKSSKTYQYKNVTPNIFIAATHLSRIKEIAIRFLQGAQRSRHRFDRDLVARGDRGVIQWFLKQIKMENVIKLFLVLQFLYLLTNIN